MNGTLVVEEKRSIIDRFKNWYKTKVIDTGLSAKAEEFVDFATKIEKGFISVVGTVATVALMFCPADGPFGEICSALATPALVKLADLKGKAMKKILVGGKRKLEGTFIGEDGHSEKVEVPEIDIKTAVAEAKGLVTDIANTATATTDGKSL